MPKSPLLLLLLTTKQPTDFGSDSLCPINRSVSPPSCRAPVRPFFVLATPLHSVHTVLASHVANRLQQTTLADLTRNCFVDAILKIVDRANASDLCL